jgi:hypothetical protein
MIFDQSHLAGSFEHPISGWLPTSPDSPTAPELVAAEPWRLQRLERVWCYIVESSRRLGSREANALSGSIVRLEDEKGCLNILWSDTRSQLVFEGIVSGAWEGENEHMIAQEHLA